MNEILTVLGQADASPASIQEVLSSLRSVDAPTQAMISQAVQYLVSGAGEVTGDQVLAVVRPLCQPSEQVVPIRDHRIMRDAQ